MTALATVPIRSLELAPTAPAAPAARLRRHARAQTDGPGVQQRADVLVTRDGRLRSPPLLAAISCELAPGTCTRVRRHEGVQIACVMLGGWLQLEPVRGGPTVLGPDAIAVLSTGDGTEYAWRAIGDEPARALMFWFWPARTRAPGLDVRTLGRRARLAGPVELVGAAARLPLAAPATLSSVVLPVGRGLVCGERGRPAYVMSTVGAISVDGARIAAGDGALVAGNRAIRIVALESTEVVVVEPDPVIRGTGR